MDNGRRVLPRSAYLERVGDSAVEYVQAQNSGIATGNEDDGHYDSEDIFAGMKTRGVDAKKRAQQAYFDFCLDIKRAARVRRRLLSVILGSLQVAIDREAQELWKKDAAENARDRPNRTLLENGVGGGANADIERAAQDALNTVRSTTEDIESSSNNPASCVRWRLIVWWWRN